MNVKTKVYTHSECSHSVFARLHASKEEIALEIETDVANVQEPS